MNALHTLHPAERIPGEAVLPPTCSDAPVTWLDGSSGLG